MNDAKFSDNGATLGTVSDDEPLYRRIHPYQIKDDGSASSGAFNDPTMSVDRARFTTIQQTLQNYSGMGVAELVTLTARQCGQDVVPAPNLLNMAHAEVRGHKTKAIAKRLARGSHVVIKPASMFTDRHVGADDIAEPPTSH